MNAMMASGVLLILASPDLCRGAVPRLLAASKPTWDPENLDLVSAFHPSCNRLTISSTSFEGLTPMGLNAYLRYVCDK